MAWRDAEDLARAATDPLLHTPAPPPPSAVPSEWPSLAHWLTKGPRERRRHDCAEFLEPVPEDVKNDAIWRCPECHRRWRLTSKPGKPSDPGACAAGKMRGPDGSRYWRPFRCRFIGRLGL
jgi:hypothetical protein